MKIYNNNIIGFFKTYYFSIIISFIIFISLMVTGFLIFDKVLMPEYARTDQEFSVPDITGYTVGQGRNILKSLGFNVSDEITEKIDYERPAGIILEQYPKPGAKCKKDRKIYVTVSKGALPVKVPDLIGLSPQDAKYRISESKLVLDSILYEFSDDFPEGVVMGQSLVVKDSVGIGDSLFIVISVGKHPSEYIIPDVKGEILNKAAETINRNGFKISEVVYMKNEDYLPNTVLDQKPKAGEIVYKGAEIRLLVSSLTEPAEQDSLEKE
ncbi:MAG: PASTA domain-containing protein [Candidatus Delongbacteria bacterium]|nr:PASTA domain-containing protein [Candidatus Delongbacteria bacterium]MCG2760394.1 PASTA domain-containing protein [Candidatus Delongbacteria bacterium]